MKKNYFFILFLALGYVATAQYSHEAQITGFRIPDGDKNHFLQVGYYYNYNHRSAVGARVSYHSGKKSNYYQSQIRYFEVNHRWRFQKPGKKWGCTLSSGPWMSYYTGQYVGLNENADQNGYGFGLATTGGLHYHILPRFSIGFTGLAMLEMFSSDYRGFYPVIVPGIGFQLAYTWN